MLPLPQISIATKPMQIGIRTTPGRFEMKYHHAEQSIEQPRAKQEIRQPRGDLRIDQTKAWDALGLTNIMVVTERIADQARNVAMEGIARIVEQGNRMAAIHTGEDAIAAIAAESVKIRFPQFQYAGEARFDNVDIQYTKRPPEISHEPRWPVIEATPRKPDIQYHRGAVEVYIRNWHEINITPPQIDMLV